MGLPVGLIIGAVGTQAAAGAWSLQQANKAKGEIKRLNDDLANLEANRQPVINPYTNISNPYANLGVATKAAEFQAEQVDISLANTLDVVRQTGAGGATALAQAALKGKQGISADIQRQEAANQKLRAQGELQVQKLKASGEQWKWKQKEGREMQKLNRTQALIDQQHQRQMAAQSAAIGSLGDIGGTLMQFGLMDMKAGNKAGTGGGLWDDGYKSPDYTGFGLSPVLSPQELQQLSREIEAAAEEDEWNNMEFENL